MIDQDAPKLTRLEQQVMNDVSYLLDKKHGKDRRFLTQTQKKRILENLFVEHGRIRGKKLKEEKLYLSDNRYDWSLNRIKDHLKENEAFRDMFKKLKNKSHCGNHCSLLYGTMKSNGWYRNST